MKHELAKQLYEAGFGNGIFHHDFETKEKPLENGYKPGWDLISTCKKCGTVNEHSSTGTHYKDFYAGCTIASDYRTPALSELIEAIGEQEITMGYLSKSVLTDTHGWYAKTKEAFIYNAPTLDVAVAKLWLLINKK